MSLPPHINFNNVLFYSECGPLVEKRSPITILLFVCEDITLLINLESLRFVFVKEDETRREGKNGYTSSMQVPNELLQ